MVKSEAFLMELLSSNLNDFLKKTSKNLPLPDKKFLRDWHAPRKLIQFM
jgi:hypothetical protein